MDCSQRSRSHFHAYGIGVCWLNRLTTLRTFWRVWHWLTMAWWLSGPCRTLQEGPSPSRETEQLRSSPRESANLRYQLGKPFGRLACQRCRLLRGLEFCKGIRSRDYEAARRSTLDPPDCRVIVRQGGQLQARSISHFPRSCRQTGQLPTWNWDPHRGWLLYIVKPRERIFECLLLCWIIPGILGKHSAPSYLCLAKTLGATNERTFVSGPSGIKCVQPGPRNRKGPNAPRQSVLQPGTTCETWCSVGCKRNYNWAVGKFDCQ